MTNLQLIEIKYLGATNTRGDRIKLIDTRFKVSVILNRNYSLTTNRQACTYLANKGFNIVAKACNEIIMKDYILVDNFIPIK